MKFISILLLALLWIGYKIWCQTKHKRTKFTNKFWYLPRTPESCPFCKLEEPRKKSEECGWDISGDEVVMEALLQERNIEIDKPTPNKI